MDNLKKLSGMKVTVMGLGSLGGGEGTVRWLCQHGAQVAVTDQKTAPELELVRQRLQDLPSIEWHLGGHPEELFEKTDMVVRNPAVRRDSSYLALSRKKGIPVEMDSSLLIKNCASQTIVGVTGTKGKTTCARNIGHILQATGRKVWVLGVDGASLLGDLDKISSQDIVVVELSSWRLEAMIEHKLSVPWAVVTSLYPDHLNTYGSLKEYWDVKKAIVDLQTIGQKALLNYDDKNIRSWNLQSRGEIAWFSSETVPAVGVGLSAKQIWLKTGGLSKKIGDEESLRANTTEAKRNILPGIFIASQLGVTSEDILSQIKSMPPLAHRQERIALVGGVAYVNDSAATIPEAGCAAVSSFGKTPIILIAGGNDKELQFGEWAACVAEANIKAIIWLPGTATEKMQNEWRNLHVKIWEEEAANMDEAVLTAHGKATPGQVVLLSPGATSFGLFNNEFERGEAFREAVLELDRGAPKAQ